MEKEKKPDLDAIEMAKAPPTKRGIAEEVAKSIIQRQEKIKRKWDRKKEAEVDSKE
jgi:hypothetical protein